NGGVPYPVIEKVNGDIPDLLDSNVLNKLITLIKRTEIQPSIVITNVNDLKLAEIVTKLKVDDLSVFPESDFRIERVSETPLPTKYYENTRFYTYRILPGYYEYYALVFGNIPKDKAVDIRIHAECFTGDFLGSLKCDCGPQLQKALKMFGDQESGILIYLRQEGRNIGLLNKMRAYHLQHKGMDTVDANLALGFDIDERDYTATALMLKDLGVTSIAMLTNNPKKIDAMKKHGIKVTKRVAHYTETQKHNENYIQTKQTKIGHLPS
ncbi:MAG: GTP cyclohydrolase II, partial [Pseudomonadota bacterium]